MWIILMAEQHQKVESCLQPMSKAEKDESLGPVGHPSSAQFYFLWLFTNLTTKLNSHLRSRINKFKATM